MPFDTPPGQVLSSVPSASNRRKSSKLAGCAGVLFQIFHGKRLFPRKSLPAERPEQVASIHTDDKLPIAKLLLIADENRSGPLRGADEEVEVQSVHVQVVACEEKMDQRAPGVVARLMGLETMPYPESVPIERKQSEPHKDMDLHLYKYISEQEKLTSTEVPIQPYNSSRRVRTKEFKTDLPARFAARQRAEVQDDIAKLKVLTKGPSVRPHHLDASLPSGPSSSRGESFGKSSMRPRKAVHLLEAEPKSLQDSIQPNHQIRSQQLQISSSRNKIGLNAVKDYKGQSGREKALAGSKDQLESYAVHESGSKQDEIKSPHVRQRWTSADLLGRRQTLDYQKPQLAGSKCPPHGATLVKRKHGLQGVTGEAKASMVEKVQPDWRQQQETSRRLSQPTNPSGNKTQRNRLTRHPSPPKSVQDSSASASSQASNCVRSSSVGTLASRVIKSHMGSNNISAEQLSSLSIRGSIGKPGGVSAFKQSTTLDLSQSVEPENREFSQDGSSSSSIYTESLQRSSMESSISSDPSVSELNSSSDECSNDPLRECITGYEREEKGCEDNSDELHDMKRLSNSFLMGSSTDSLSDSLTMSLDDTASSQSQLDPSAKAFGLIHSYSERNTAAILQELLTALSSSSSQRKSTESWDELSDVTEFSSLVPDLRQEEKSQNLSARHGQYNDDLSRESTFQESASSDSADTSQHSQANGNFEKDDFVTSKDSPSAELQSKEECHPETAHPGQTQMQYGPIREHADFADCEALMNAISKMHHIDPEAIGLTLRASKHQEKAMLNVLPGDGIFASLVDSDELECEQTQKSNWGLSSSTTLMPEDDADSIYRSDFDSSFRIGHDEAVAWNKKLVTDCINEVFKSLSKQLYKFSSSVTEHSSANHVLNRVYKQLDEWKAMATNMNLDDMIEKEMNVTTRSWRNISNETDEVAEALESSILSGLLEEMLLELM